MTHRCATSSAGSIAVEEEAEWPAMFKNKIVMRADPPSPSPFLLLQLQPSPSRPPPALELQILCWKLSRRWRIACSAQPSAVFVIYQKALREAADRAVSELVAAIPDIAVGSEEELTSPVLIAKAVEIGLTCVMLDHKWTYVGDNSFIYSALTSEDERNPLCVLNVCVQPDADIGFVFLVSPEVLRFSRYKISDLLTAKDSERLSFDEQIEVSDCDFPKACTLIPSLCEGHVIGVSKQLPTGENFGKLEELWKIKISEMNSLQHGVALCNEYFISVQVSHGDQTKRQWCSSAYVLQGSGFTPAPQSIRLLKAPHALESFTKIVGDWDFFSQGMLKIKEITPFGSSLKVDGWEKAANVSIRRNNIAPSAQGSSIEADFTFKDLQMALDFRTPKPATHVDQIVKELHNQQEPISLRKICAEKTLECMSEGSHIRSTIKFVPSFRKSSLASSGMQRDHGVPGGLGERMSKEVILESSISSRENAENMPVHACTNTDINSISKSLPPIKNYVPNPRPDPKLDGAYPPSFTRRKSMEVQKPMEISPKSGLNDGDHANEKIAPLESSKAKRSKCPKKEKDKMLPGNKISEKTENVALGRKKSVMKERKGEDIAEGATKMKAKPCLEQSGITDKVMNFHKRGQLQSLTIADLKCFLSSKKAKLGGKKEELVQRVIGLLP